VKPLRVATATGLGCTLLGALATVAVVVEALRGGTPPGWASLAAVTLVLSGLQLTMLGVIGEYVGSLVVTANRRPQSVVREIVRPAADAREPERAP
jgi:hypothetical protein